MILSVYGLSWFKMFLSMTFLWWLIRLTVAETFQAMIGGQFEVLNVIDAECMVTD